MTRLSGVPRSSVRDVLLLAAIIAIAVVLYFYRIEQIPPGFYFDQAFNAFDVLRLLQGQFAIYFPANTGEEPLFNYLLMVGVSIFGATALALKVTSAVVGLANLPLIYGFVKYFYRSVRLAILTTLLCAVSFWHIYYSRLGLRIIIELSFTLITFWFFWRALNNRRWQDYVWTGVFFALSLYTYPTARILPVAFLMQAAWFVWFDRPKIKEYARGLLITFGVAALVFLPLGVYFVFNPDQFLSHMLQVSVVSPSTTSKPLVIAVAENVGKIAGMFFVAGDRGAIRNLPGRPIFDPILAILFLVGLGILLFALFQPRSTKLERSRAFFLFAWMGVTLSVSAFSDDAPNFLRTLPALPAVMLMPALAIESIWDRLGTTHTRIIAGVVLAGMVALSAGLNLHDYFEVFANDPGLYYTFDEDKLEVADWINDHAYSNILFLAPLWAQQGTISLLTRNAPLKSFDSRDTVILPAFSSSRDAIFAFPPEQDKRVRTMASRLGGLADPTILKGSNGIPLLLLVRVPADNLPSPSEPLRSLNLGGPFLQPQKKLQARWEDGIELLGYSIEPNGRGRNLAVTLFLHSTQTIAEDYTFSIKALDKQNRVWGQEDKFAGDNSYPTSHWGPGDLVVERFYPGLDACAPVGDYHLILEAYDPKTGDVLEFSDNAGPSVSLGETHAEAAQSNRLEDLQPTQRLDLQIPSNQHLIGVTSSAETAKPGDDFTLQLYWRGTNDTPDPQTVSIQVKDSAGHVANVADRQLTPPPAERGVCTLFDLKLPQEATPGEAAILVNGIGVAKLMIEDRK